MIHRRTLCAALFSAFVCWGSAVPGVASTSSSVPRSPYVPADYMFVFGDEFDGAALDTSKWWTRFVYDGPNGPGTLDYLKDEQQRYRENRNHVVSGGVLKLTARKTTTGTTYESGAIRSKKTMKYGYFEVRAKVPGGQGVFPAAWLNPSATHDARHALVWPPEIDIFEFVNNVREERSNMMHSGVSVGTDGSQGGRYLYTDPDFHRDYNYYRAAYNFPDDFHIFGALWDTDDTVTIYIDGRRIQKRAYTWTNPSATPGFAHVLVNLAIGGRWAGKFGIDDTAFPQALEVDYIRVYQKPGSPMLGDDARGNSALCNPAAEC